MLYKIDLYDGPRGKHGLGVRSVFWKISPKNPNFEGTKIENAFFFTDTKIFIETKVVEAPTVRAKLSSIPSSNEA